MRKAITLLMLLALCYGSYSLSVRSLEIDAELDQNGGATFTENYALNFTSPFELNDFKEKAKKNGTSLLAWEADFNFFYPHFETRSNAHQNTSIAFDEKTGYPTLKYTLSQPFARLLREEQRAAFFTIDYRQFADFIDGSTIVVPENTTIKIIFPPSSQVDRGSVLPPKSELNYNELTLHGIQTNSLKIFYSVIKPISPSGNDFLQGFSGVYALLLPAAVLLAIAAYFKREEIEENVERFLVEHSEIKTRDTDEELDFDLE